MRTLNISIEPDLDTDMAQFAERAKLSLATGQYQGEYLNFATPATFFSQLTAHRWNILSALLGSGIVGVRELARRLGREVKRVHEDTKVLVQLGLLEKTDKGALRCPYERIDIDMSLVAQPPLPSCPASHPSPRLTHPVRAGKAAVRQFPVGAKAQLAM